MQKFSQYLKESLGAIDSRMFSDAHTNLRALKKRLDVMDRQVMNGEYDSSKQDLQRNLKMLQNEINTLTHIIEDLLKATK